MGFQCVPQVLGLVYGDGMRKDGKGQAKHRANVRAIVHEAFEIADPIDGHPIPIRKSASDTYDKTRTVNNKYTGARTAVDVLRLLDEEADKTKVEVRTVDKETGETVIHKRSLPSTTVLAAAVIFNPPSKVAKDWTPEQNDKFFTDCEEVLAQIPFGKINKKGEIVGPKYYIFRKQNIVASAEHWDEGEDLSPPVYTANKHNFYKPEGEDGKYYGKFIDSYNLSHLNKIFAKMMRERGWDIDDPDCTDWEKFNDDKAYRAKRKSKIRQGGKSVNNYVADKVKKDAEATFAEAQEIIARTERVCREVKEQAEADAEAIREEARADAEKIDREKEQAQREVNNLMLKGELVRRGIDLLTGTRASILAEFKELENSCDAAREAAKTSKAEAKAAEADRDAAKNEADELRRGAVAQAEQAARETQARLEADSRAAWQKWLENKKKHANDVENKIIKDAETKAAEIIAAATEAAEGEYAFLLKWLDDPRQRYKTGETFLEVARKAHSAEIRKKRVSTLPPEVRDAGKGQRTGRGDRDITDD